MNPLIDPEMVETIRRIGKASEKLPDRVEILEAHGLPYDREAENVVITGCQVYAALPAVLSSLARIFERGGLSFTFLSKESCCGNPIYRPAIRAEDEAALSECRALSREFIATNVERARELGARRLVLFCSPCYPIYRYAFPDEDVVFYPQAIDEVAGELELEGEVDYYAGCYRLHRKLAPVPMDLKSSNDLLARIRGLKVHRIKAPVCCTRPDGVRHMLDGVRTDRMVHICTGCYFQARLHVPEDRKTRVLMLPELVELACQKDA